MKHLAKRSLSLLMAVLMVLSLVPAAPHAHAATYGAEWEYGVSSDGNSTPYDWLSGAFKTADTDYIYEEGQAYDWTVTLSPTRGSATVTVEASIVDGNGVSVGVVTKEVAVSRAPSETTIVSPADFPNLGERVGDFTLSVDILFNGEGIAWLTANFARTGAAGSGSNVGALEFGAEWNYQSGQEWLTGAFNSAEEDFIFEGDKAYDWTVTLCPTLASATCNITATIEDEAGNVLTRTAEVAVSKAPATTVIASYQNFPELTTSLTGKFKLTVTVNYNNKDLAQLVAVFGRTSATGGDQGGNEGGNQGGNEGTNIYGSSWEYASASDGTNYEWLSGEFKTADTDYIYGTSYDWSVTLCPGKAAAAVTVESTIVDVTGTTVATKVKDVNVTKAPSVTTLVSHSDFPDLVGKTGDFLLTVTIYYNGAPIARLTSIFGFTGNAANDEVGGGDQGGGDQGDVPAPELGTKVEFSNSSYKSWMTVAFNTAAEGLVYEAGSEYDWTITLKQGRGTYDLTVDATVTDASGNLVASVSALPATAGKNQNSVLLSAADVNMDANLAGTFTLVCIVKLGGSPAIKVTTVFSRVGASRVPGTVNWEYLDTYEWITGEFVTGDDDMIYKGTQSYDWYATISPTATSATVDVMATVVDENGNVVSTYTGVVEAAKGPAKTKVIASNAFPELTKELFGTFTMTCQLSMSGKVYAEVVAVFSREQSDGTETSGNYDWIKVEYQSADEDSIFEGEQAYDWAVTLQQQKVETIVEVHATVTDKLGNLVGEVTKTADIVKSEAGVPILEAAEFAELTTARGGEFTLVCEVTYNGDPVARVTKLFSRPCQHNALETIPGKDPTCTDFGMTEGKKCLHCGEITVAQKPIDALNHDIYVVAPRVEPTCKTEGMSAHEKCNRCSYEKVGSPLPVLTEHVPGAEATCTTPQTCIHCPEVIITPVKEHVYSINGNKACINGCGKTRCENEGHKPGAEATCTAPQLCTVCNAELAAALNHDMQQTAAEVPATCGVPGKTAVLTCARGCGHTEGGAEIPALTHNMQQTAAEVPATCTAVGKTAVLTCARGCGHTEGGVEIPMKDHEWIAATTTTPKTCKNCGKTEGGVATCNHTWDEGKITTEPTCTAEGVKTFTCSACSETKTEKVNALTHNMQQTAAEIPASCMAPGKTAVLSCANGCGKTEGGVEIPVLEHNMVETAAAVPATCVAPGKTAVQACANEGCNVIYGGEDVKPLNHAYTGEGGKCVNGCGKTKCGNEGHDWEPATLEKPKTCKVCGETEGDVATCNHKWNDGEITTAPTCTEQGVKTFTCSACSETKTEKVSALGHKPGAAATCTTAQTCTVCNVELAAKLAHTEVTVPGKAATCTKTGLTEGKKCSACGTETVKQTEIAKLAHTEVTVPGKAATCTETGLTEGKKCSVCGTETVKQTEIAKLAHTEVTVPGKAATCTETGLTEGKKCSVCGTETVEQTVIPVLNHNFVDGTCANCGAKEEENEPVLPGDADGNGKVNLRDAILVLKAINGGNAVDDAFADFNGDGKVNLKDAILILKEANKK